ncbi:DUF2950 domain-containing protein [Ramlibacter sp. G-1-2-2]|uniref:DUF2950 domain-containing protein n=1 Tax=Ramlibacter agri TaxID=2728837 RepID=A0A848H5B7_9BURK|nr:DUF2950 domain-containing protein [Ramlibacter agri]NML45764.1 DUF2950 domain-containing protein [Ramlibacter agri]
MHNPSHPAFRLRTLARSLALAAALLVPLAAAAQQTTFATPEAAADALQRALQANDSQALVALFGDKYKDLVGTGEPGYDAARRAEAAQALATRRSLEEIGADRRILRMGAQAWPFAIPIVREGIAWRFASEQGAEELLNRRVGANERHAILVMRALVDAQREYAQKDRMGDGVLQYASRIGSTPGKHDGLYWPDTAGADASPLGPFVADASQELAGHKAGDPYGGYYFRILTRQGAAAPGGAHSYMINGHMLAGFAAVAWPAEWGRSGVMTFVVSQNGKVYEKNLGPKGAPVTSFDPGAGWIEVPPEE